MECLGQGQAKSEGAPGPDPLIPAAQVVGEDRPSLQGGCCSLCPPHPCASDRVGEQGAAVTSRMEPKARRGAVAMRSPLGLPQLRL